MRTRVIILFPLITSASVTFNERAVLHDPSTLPQHSDYGWPDREPQRKEEEEEVEEEGEEEEEEKEEKQGESPNYTPSNQELRSLVSKILIGCVWILHRRPTTEEEECIAFSTLSSARGSEVECCSIDSCHEAASTPRVSKILSRVSLSRSLFICRLRIESVMSADSAADLRRTV